MVSAAETLRATLSEAAYKVLGVLAHSTDPLSGRKIAAALKVAPGTANDALSTLAAAGYVTSARSGRAKLWQLEASHPAISAWLQETLTEEATTAGAGASPYSTGGGGTRLEHSYAACLIASFLAGEALTELGDSVAVDSIRLQASDSSDVDDILVVGRDHHGQTHHVSIAVRRNPALTASDSTSVPLIRDFLAIATGHWSAVSAGRWRTVLAVSTNSNAIVQIGALAELARSLPGADALARRLSESGRTNSDLRVRHEHLVALVAQASIGLVVAAELSTPELTWRMLFGLRVRSLRLERTDRTDRTFAVTALQRMLHNGTPAAADALFSRLEEQVGQWAPQAAVLPQSVVRYALNNYPLSRSARFAGAWDTLDRLGTRLRESIRPGLRSASQSLELQRTEERARLETAIRSAGTSAAALVVTGEPDVGKSALALRVAETVKHQDATVCSLSLRDLPHAPAQWESQWGGHALDDVLATGEVRPVRLVLVDGAEAVLEGKGKMLRTLAVAARKAGFGIVAVTRTDGSRQVRDELERALEIAATGATMAEQVVAEHVVAPLTQTERDSVTGAFTALSRLSGDTRARWLLGRPGLVDALLRTGAELDPAGLLCEADVFGAVWRSLVRRDEIHRPDTASPDDREHAALAAARRTLGLAAAAPQGSGSAELRSDGVLRPPHNPAFATGDEFSTDLFRDFALCRLFILYGWEPLQSAGAPRWSIRAARLGCQAALLDRSNPHRWTRLSASFTQLAELEGQRWQEVPYEALLTLGDAETAIRELWSVLTAENGEELMTLLRLAETRYVRATIGDPFALAPLVQIAFCEQPTITGHARLGGRGTHEVIRELVLAWLRGMAGSHTQPHPLRQRVRDTILHQQPTLYDDFAIEALACLGPDLDDHAEAYLRAVAQDSPGHLHDAVESTGVAISMSHARPMLLLDLAEAYYIEMPDLDDPWGHMSMLDDGIRDFQHGLAPGYGVPQAAWFYGPFYRLLHARPVDTLSFINRMLDHAANFRVRELDRRQPHIDDHDNNDPEGLFLDLPGIGRRLYVGDGHVWSWYRGTSVGPRACTSALLAVERFADQLLEQLGMSAHAVVEALLRDCHNLAMPALAVGMLTRHPDATSTLLDPFLTNPAIWQLENARVGLEHGVRARDADADTLTGSERREHTFQHTVGAMVVTALVRGDDERLDQLRALGTALAEAARAELPDTAPGRDDRLAVIDSWAEHFRADNYRTSRSGNHIAFEFERPERIEQILAPRTAELETTNALYGLQYRYGRHNTDPHEWPVDTLGDDLALARGIAETDHAPEGMLWPENALVAVAAAAVRAHALNLAVVDESHLQWSVEVVLWAAENPQIDDMSISGSMFSMGADRAAAAAVPLLLLSPFDHLELDQAHLEHCLRALTTSLFDEVRAIYVKGCQPVWAAPCGPDPATQLCRRHTPAWTAAIEGLTDCRLGPWDTDTRTRQQEPLPPPFYVTLPAVADEGLMVNRLRMPLAGMVDARQVPCLRHAVEELWAPLWDAHRRGLAYWWRKGYDHHAHLTHEPIAQRMITTALDGDRDTIAAHITTFAADAKALNMLFDGFATVFTHDHQLRPSLSGFWPWAMDVALTAIGDGAGLRAQHHWFDYMTAALLPTPSPHSWDSDLEQVLRRCRENWIQPHELGDLADRWLQLAVRQPKGIDAVIKFARSAPPRWQATTALTWIETIANERYDLMANHVWLLEEWLTELRSDGLITTDSQSRYHRIVDGLAAAGDRAAVRLQQLDE